MILNKSAVERGLAHASLIKTEMIDLRLEKAHKEVFEAEPHDHKTKVRAGGGVGRGAGGGGQAREKGAGAGWGRCGRGARRCLRFSCTTTRPR